MLNATPVEDAAAILVLEVVDEKAECREPGCGDDQVHGVVEHRGGEWEEPDERQDQRQGGDNLGVDLTRVCIMLVICPKRTMPKSNLRGPV